MFNSFGKTANSLVVLLAAATASSAQSTWIVDQGGDGDFTSLQSAINGAQSGDTILAVDVPQGESLVIQGKGVTITARSAREDILGSIEIRDVPAGDVFSLSGFELSDQPYAASISNCEGAVHMENCILFSGGIEVVNTRHLSLNRVFITAWEGADALRVQSSNVSVHGSILRGFLGADGSFSIPCTDGEDGGDAVRLLQNSSLRATDSQFRGGLGGFSSTNCYSGSSGEGIVMDGTSRTFRRDCVITSAVGGLDVDSSIQSVRLFIEEYFSAHSTTPITVRSAAGDRVFLIVGEPNGYRPLGAERGALQISSFYPSPGLPGPVALIPLGTVPTNGGTLEAEVPPLGLLGPGGSDHAATVGFQIVAYRPGVGPMLSALHVANVFGDDVPVRVDEGPIRVLQGASTPGLGRSWTAPFPGLELALERSWGRFNETREFWVTQGTYALSSQDREFRLRVGDELYGGFVGTEAALEDRDPDGPRTVLSADVLGNDGPSAASRVDNGRILLGRDPWVSPMINAPIRLDRFSLRGAYSTSGAPPSLVLTASAQVHLNECEMTDNRGDLGLLIAARETTLESCLIRENVGMSMDIGRSGSSQPNFVINTMIRNNVSSTSLVFGRGITRLQNSSVVNNRVSSGSSAIELGFPGSGNSQVFNSIIFGNNSGGAANFETQFRSDGNATVLFSHSCLSGWAGQFGGTAIIGADPQFASPGPDGVVGTADDDLRLTSGSPCVDSGANFFAPNGVTLDLDGTARFKDDPGTPDTGSGVGPIVDMGAYEL